MTSPSCSQCGRPLADAATGPLCDVCTVSQPSAEPASEQVEQPSTPAEVSPPARESRFRPWATYGLIAINVIVYLLMVFSGISPTEPTTPQMIQWGANYGPLTLTSQWWRILSSAFLHIGLFHIVINMVSLLFLGALAEAIYKRTAYLFIYVLSGAAGAVASAAAFPGRPSAGASGAIFGIAGALIAVYKLGRLQLPPDVVKRDLATLVVFTGFNLLRGAVHAGLDNTAHLGGLAAGLMMGIIIAVHIRRYREYRRSRDIAITLMIVIVVGGYIAAREARAFTIHMELASAAASRGNLPDARNELLAALERRPNNSTAHAFLGAVYTRMGDLARAEGEFRRTVELDPRDITARFQLAVVYFSEHRLADAADTMRQILQTSPNEAQFHEFLAEILAEQGSMAEAQQEHERAIQLLQESQQERRR
jgi:membrane associated rhomboid family serine protease